MNVGNLWGGEEEAANFSVQIKKSRKHIGNITYTFSIK